tara:strand:+ start:30 stop:1463 length:1434 start_codon:yes stop_codon:yes gene_type:complete
MSTSVLLRSDIDQNVRILLNSAEEKVGDLLGHRLSFLYGENLIKALPIDALRIVTEMVSDDSNNQALKNLLINTIVTSERLWAGSGIISLMVFIEASKDLQKKRALGIASEYDQTNFNRAVCINSRRTNSNQIFDSIRQMSRSKYELEVVRCTLNLVGSASAQLSDKTSLNTVVSVDQGYNFKLGPPDLFWTASSASLVSLYNTKVLCVDGIVESMSEVHNIVDSSFKEGQSAVLFARGFNDDVVNTLAVNHSRGKLNVIPIVVPYDMMGVNQLVDVAVCSGCDVVSSIKGELISTVKWKDLVEVNRIIISHRGMTIENDKTLIRVASHKSQIQNKLSSTFRDLEGNEEGLTSEQLEGIEATRKNQREIYQERIMSLMSGGAKISLGKEHGSSKGIKQDRISSILRMYSQASKNGLTSIEDCSKVKIDPLADKIVSKLLSSGITLITPPALISGFRIGVANAIMMNKIGAWLTIDEK